MSELQTLCREQKRINRNLFALNSTAHWRQRMHSKCRQTQGERIRITGDTINCSGLKQLVYLASLNHYCLCDVMETLTESQQAGLLGWMFEFLGRRAAVLNPWSLALPPLTGSAAPEANAQYLSPPTSTGATTLSASVYNPSELSLGGFRVGCGMDSTMIGMCLDGYALEEVESIEQRIAVASSAFHPVFRRQTQALTPRQQSSEQIRGRCLMPFKGCTSSTRKAQGALINIPCVKAADMEGPHNEAMCILPGCYDTRPTQLEMFCLRFEGEFQEENSCRRHKGRRAVALFSVGREQGTMDSRLNKWGYGPRSSYYDNVRPLAYPDSDAVLICFDISRPETLDSVIKKWQGETQEFCPNAKVVLVGCKLDMRTDVSTLRELSKQRLIPVTHEQGSTIARQMGAVAYVECTSKVSENSVRDVFHITTVASVQRAHKPQVKRSSSRRGLKRVSQLPLPPLPGRTEQMDEAPTMRKDRAKSCVLM
ncbi:hypothetical protein NQZ68_005664 [Dissostichus eleginoides]|nr:hypothetical protein NQZ68_005664 [Dissostichus eleginoides]